MPAIKGLDKILKNLEKLDSKHNIRIHKAAARAGATALRKNAETRLSPGNRRKMGVSLSRTFSKTDLIVFRIGPYKDHWALAFQEFGAPAHDISVITKGKRASGKQALTVGKGNENSNYNLVRGTIRHPGVRKTNFLSKALTDGKEEALEKIGNRYWSRINKLL